MAMALPSGRGVRSSRTALESPCAALPCWPRAASHVGLTRGLLIAVPATQVHTGFLPPDSSEHALHRGDAPSRPFATSTASAAVAASSPSSAMTGPPLSWMDADDLSVCAATFAKEDVDLVDRDHRFPRDWRLTLHYRNERAGGSVRAGLGLEGGGCVGRKST